MSTRDPHPSFAVAEQVAPEPVNRDAATVDGWARHYAALALAAHAAFRDACDSLPRNPEPGSRPDIGYLALIGNTATAAAVAILSPGEGQDVAETLWDFTPELGSLNGESVDWLATTLDARGVNPADLYRWYEAADFRSPSINAGASA